MDVFTAREHCKVRGYIARDSKPNEKYWKNTTPDSPVHFINITNKEDLEADDWGCHDPVGEETSLGGDW